MNHDGITANQRRLISQILQSEGIAIEQVAVFGSRAQGRHRANSDLDLVLYGNVDEAVCNRLWTLFQDSALPFSVDIKRYNGLTYLPLRAHVDAVAKPLAPTAES